MAKSAVKSKAPAWAAPLDKWVRAHGKSWSKIADAVGRSEGGVRHWRNGTRPIGLQEFIDLCTVVGADPYAILHEVYPGKQYQDQLLPRQQVVLAYFDKLFRHQQDELLVELRAMFDANQITRKELGQKPLVGVSNHAVRAAFGDVVAMTKPRKKRHHEVKRRREPGTAMDDFLPDDD